MNHLAAYALLVLGGNESPSADDIAKVMKGAGAQPNPESIKVLLESGKGKKFHELVAAG